MCAQKSAPARGRHPSPRHAIPLGLGGKRPRACKTYWGEVEKGAGIRPITRSRSKNFFVGKIVGKPEKYKIISQIKSAGLLCFATPSLAPAISRGCSDAAPFSCPNLYHRVSPFCVSLLPPSKPGLPRSIARGFVHLCGGGRIIGMARAAMSPGKLSPNVSRR